MASFRMIAVLAVVALAVSAHAQTAQVANRLIPVTIRTLNTGVGAVGQTPATPVLSGRKLLQTVPTYGKAAVLSPGFTSTILPLIKKTGNFAFLGQAKQAPGTDKVDYTFIFGSEAQPFLKSLAVSGQDFTFVGAYAILPQDETATNAPNSEFSASGFVSTDGTPTTAVVTTQTPQGVVPNVALRFDYTQTGTSVSPTVSVYYTDRKASVATGGYSTTASNLTPAYGVYIAPDGTVYPGQG